MCVCVIVCVIVCVLSGREAATNIISTLCFVSPGAALRQGLYCTQWNRLSGEVRRAAAAAERPRYELSNAVTWPFHEKRERTYNYRGNRRI